MKILYGCMVDIGFRLSKAGYWMIGHSMQFLRARVLRAGHRMAHLGFVGGLRRARESHVQTS